MAKVGNETKLILSLVKERMSKQHDDWLRRSDNPNANSHNGSWMAGYEYANREWLGALYDVVDELETK